MKTQVLKSIQIPNHALDLLESFATHVLRVPDARRSVGLGAQRRGRLGTLGMVTELMGEHYEEEGESKLRELATLLEPTIIVVMGVIVAASAFRTGAISR